LTTALRQRQNISMAGYVHGYSARESQRLSEQAAILGELLHHDTAYAGDSRVLEAGCGVGAQTLELARRSPGASFTSVDISEISLERARASAAAHGLENVTFEQQDVMALSYPDAGFDHVFVCFLLEHLADPDAALQELRRVLQPGGSLTLIEGDHGSCFWHPRGEAGPVVWQCLIEEQQALGNNPLIGRELYPRLVRAGFKVLKVAPRWVYADASQPELLAGGVNQIFVPMVETARQASLASGRCDAATWERGIRELTAIAGAADGSLFYTWFRGVALK